jgi:predicted SAM-dependent methyltransferase
MNKSALDLAPDGHSPPPARTVADRLAQYAPLRATLGPAHRWWQRWAGRRRLRRLARASRRRIVIGASGVTPPGWTQTEVDYLDLLDPADWRENLSPGSLDAILAEHVWEHLTLEEGFVAAGRCFAYVKPGGYVRAAVPDGLSPDTAYLDLVRPGGSGAGADDHKVLYTYRTFAEVFEASGFRVELLEYFDEDGEFHYREWSPEDGMIHRSSRFDERNGNGRLAYTSVVLDAWRDE